jgi:hypothetical protein
LQDTETNKLQKSSQDNADSQAFVLTHWEKLKADLMRERAIWAVSVPPRLEKWRLDFTEGG